MFIYIILFLVVFGASFGILKIMIPKLKKANIVGKDMHKPDLPEVPEMGGMGVVVAFSFGVVLAMGIEVFFDDLIPVNIVSLFAVLATVLMISLVGILDDLLDISQKLKAVMPVFAALPLVAIKEGHSILTIPFLGRIDFGLFYPLVLVPVGITGAANAVNMLAGFNGLEVGMGAVAIASLAIISLCIRSMTAFVILMVALACLLAALYYNWYPAKLLIGDVGTLSIGAIIASSVIVGNFETAGIIIIIPYFVDFVIKLPNRLPKSFGKYNNGNLYCPNPRPVGLCQLIMKLTGGIKEKNLVLTLMGIEAAFGAFAILLYVR